MYLHLHDVCPYRDGSFQLKHASTHRDQSVSALDCFHDLFDTRSELACKSPQRVSSKVRQMQQTCYDQYWHQRVTEDD